MGTKEKEKIMDDIESEGEVGGGERDVETEPETEGASKRDIIRFVRDAQENPRYRKNFVEGEWWSNDGEFRQVYVDEGWTDENGFLEKKGAAIINYCDSMYDKNHGFDMVPARLNELGLEGFIKEAVELHQKGEFEEEEEGFTKDGGFLGDGDFF